MVARINTSKSLSKILNYNEQKVQHGKAEILLASGFIKDADKLNFYDKLSHFERHTSLNERATTNALHISLNFDPSEKISNEKMMEIAETYMNKIGFGNQPYLVYRHHDSVHPHLHIVSTNIERDGKRISMHWLGANQSEKARKEIEGEYNLVKAESKKVTEAMEIVPVNAQKINYGKSETKRGIANVLMMVLNQYKYTSLQELNAVLKLYNVTADRGSENSRMYQQKGLVYRILDESGNKVGKPIKASAFYMKPTLAFLEKKFSSNEALRAPFKKKLQTSIAWILNKQSKNIEAFIKTLEKENISTVLRIGKEGMIYEITYVDHKTKSVFNGSDLGKIYSAKMVLERCQYVTELTQQLSNNKQEGQSEAVLPEQHKVRPTQQSQQQAGILPENTTATPVIDYAPYQLKKRKKKKKKRLSI